ncbi:TMEM175 family protein [Micromonospora sonneratiae]|uniref:TMEM175 family protein n=1 Tax=Micromonospora sonneratiae TaxID=1184706 RepID=A0ABW3Y838_9ACTN
MEAFSDGVIAILITVMVLDLRIPHGTTWSALTDSAPVFLSYVLSFVYLGIYWNNHHHMLMATDRVSGLVLWANLHLLFWLSLIPFTTGWMGENEFAATPAAVYGIVLLAAAVAYFVLRSAIIRVQGNRSTLAIAVGRDLKGKISPVLYAIGIGFAAVNRWLSLAVYVAVALMWLVPDRRVERTLGAFSRR